MTDTIERKVYQALDNALENGYDPRLSTPDDITHDLLDRDADLEGVHVHDIMPHVVSWLAKRNAANS